MTKENGFLFKNCHLAIRENVDFLKKYTVNFYFKKEAAHAVNNT